MNKALKSFAALACIALASFSCQKIEESNDIQTSKVVNFTASALETRTAFGTPDGNKYPTLWTANDAAVKVSLNFATAKDAVVTPSSDGKTASFSVEIVPGESDDSYSFYSVSPSTASIGFNHQYNSATIDIPASQTPSEGSVSEDSQILVAQTDAFEEFPTTVKMNYSHLTAYGRFELLNLDLGTATINSIALTASKNWVGRYFYYYSDGSLTENSASSTITIETSATKNLWFACAPVDLSGETLKVTVNTTNGPLVKEITLPANTEFESGVINKFAIDMDGIGFEESKIYTLVTDISDLTEDSKVIIAAPNVSYAMSTAQNSNNRAQASVTKKDNTIVDPADNVQIFTLEQGSVDNTVAFNTGNGYIYAASATSNYLRTQDVIDANASFSAEITDGGAILIAQGANTRNVLRYNGSNNPPVFSCYAASSSVQGVVNIYKLNGSGTDTPLIVVDDTEYTITVSDAENGSVEASAAAAKKGTEITLNITPSEGYKLKNLTVLNANQEVVFSTEDAEVNVFIMPASDVTIYAEFEESAGITVTKTMSSIVTENNYSISAGSDVTCYTSFKLDDVVTVSTSGEANCGSFWGTTTQDWRLYQNKGGDVTISVPSDYALVSAKITFSVTNNGALYDGATVVPSGEEITLSGNSKTWTVGNTGTATNGQVRITKIEVTYK